MYKALLLTVILLSPFQTFAQPAAPTLYVNTEGADVKLNWSSINDATGYRLFYAPYPFQGEASIASIDLHSATEFAAELWQGAAYYVAIQAYDENQQSSDYSNIGFLQIIERSAEYRNFWRTITKQLSDHAFSSSDFLYSQHPDIGTCFAGSLSDAAKNRQWEVLNQTRALHQLAPVAYDNNADFEMQQSALIQRANNFLSHTPAIDSLCYSQAGFDGSRSSNLHLGHDNSDPAEDLISLIDDAFNLSSIAGVGHRRALLNPFLQFTSYGHVLGASATKVMNFADSSTSNAADIPDFVAFPYLRYPYSFFSDKTSDKKTPWNLSLIEDKFSIWANQQDYFSHAILTVRQKDNNHQMTVNNIHTDTSGSGVPNNLSWEVNDWQYDTWYTVTIDNIHYSSGEVTSIKYDVLIDYKNIIDLKFQLEAGDWQNGLVMQGLIADDHDNDSYIVDLQAGSHLFTGSSQFSNMAFYIAVYDMNKQLLTARDESFTLDLPAGRYTLVVSNCYQQTCYNQPKDYRVQVN